MQWSAPAGRRRAPRIGNDVGDWQPYSNWHCSVAMRFFEYFYRPSKVITYTHRLRSMVFQGHEKLSQFDSSMSVCHWCECSAYFQPVICHGLLSDFDFQGAAYYYYLICNWFKQVISISWSMNYSRKIVDLHSNFPKVGRPLIKRQRQSAYEWRHRRRETMSPFDRSTSAFYIRLISIASSSTGSRSQVINTPLALASTNRR